MTFNAPCAGYADTAPRCDCEGNCYATHHDSEDALAGCLTACESAGIECADACGIEDDLAAADSTRDDCREPCDSSLGDCLSPCTDEQTSCISDCYTTCAPLDVGSAPWNDCFFPCQDDCDSAYAECADPCYQERNGCYVDCEVDYQTTVGAAKSGQPDCLAPCCNNRTHGTRIEGVEYTLSQCEAGCQQSQIDADTEAVLAYLECDHDNLAVGSGTTFDSLQIEDQEASTPCQAALATAQAHDAHTEAECEYQCRLDFDRHGKVCADETPCLLTCLKTYDEALETCLGASFEGDLGGVDYNACVFEARKAKWDCDIQCCYNVRGRDRYTPCYLDCAKGALDCQQAVKAGCPTYPGSSPGDPCFDPSSDDCTEAMDAYTTCTNEGQEACAVVYAACVPACLHTADPPCSECYLLIDTPIAPP